MRQSHFFALLIFLQIPIWAMPAAAQEYAGDPHCTTCEGYYYLSNGNYPKALEIYQTLSAEGNRTAMTNLGYMYQRGLGMPVDYVQALHWYQQAAGYGDATAMTDLGFMYQHALGVPQDDDEAKRWYGKAAGLGNENARNRLQELTANGQ